MVDQGAGQALDPAHQPAAVHLNSQQDASSEFTLCQRLFCARFRVCRAPAHGVHKLAHGSAMALPALSLLKQLKLTKRTDGDPEEPELTTAMTI